MCGERSALVHSLAVFSDQHGLSRSAKQILAVMNLGRGRHFCMPWPVCLRSPPTPEGEIKKEELFSLGWLSGKMCCVTTLSL